MAEEEGKSPLQDIPVPRNKSDALDMLTVVLLWLESNGHPYAAIDVNDAMERLMNNQSS